jgi:Zn-dependent protease with chaperone function
MKHPVAAAFVAAVAISLALVGVVLNVYTLQQAPWALAAVVLAFPFFWFFAWLVTNGISWWRESTGGGRSAEDQEGTDAP